MDFHPVRMGIRSLWDLHSITHLDRTKIFHPVRTEIRSSRDHHPITHLDRSNDCLT
ncbi:uncharacterized protein G2W53_008000 [Senna tora]|uniref:Uncharacterized protein n=1 Tax=Senna tora TaxID=362788 RepID=A0A834X992_9FABA|nr:uncharacterized protein G2W53_008000 [Senna tora]